MKPACQRFSTPGKRRKVLCLMVLTFFFFQDKTMSNRGTFHTSRLMIKKYFSRIPAWIEACRRPELRSKSVEYMYKNKCICSLHFEKFMYNKRNLLRGAVPTLKLPKMLLQEIEVQSKVLPNIMTGDSPSKRKLDIATEILNEWDDTTREDFLQACDAFSILVYAL